MSASSPANPRLFGAGCRDGWHRYRPSRGHDAQNVRTCHASRSRIATSQPPFTASATNIWSLVSPTLSRETSHTAICTPASRRPLSGRVVVGTCRCSNTLGYDVRADSSSSGRDRRASLSAPGFGGRHAPHSGRSGCLRRAGRHWRLLRRRGPYASDHVAGPTGGRQPQRRKPPPAQVRENGRLRQELARAVLALQGTVCARWPALAGQRRPPPSTP